MFAACGRVPGQGPPLRRPRRTTIASGGITTTKALRLVIEIAVIIIAALLLAAVVRAFVVETYEVPTGSMRSTIEVGDRILSARFIYAFGEPQKGDIVTFDTPMDDNVVLVKRCIATGGDVVDIRMGNLYINGELQVEEYVHGEPTYELYPTYKNMEISFPYTIPNGYIWVMGDNRTNSSDSRYFGPIDVHTVTGKVFFRYWPFDRFGPL